LQAPIQANLETGRKGRAALDMEEVLGQIRVW
jgi:hypothetical protein